MKNKKDNNIKLTGHFAGNAQTTQYMANDVERFISPGGHGYAAEQMNDFFDKAHGHNAKVVGGDNAKNGADRLVNGINIQSKYCSSGEKCVDSCFDNGKFRYMNTNGQPMKIEVPSDKYDDAVRAMENRIKAGEVPGISDPQEAKNIIKKGAFTYEQTKNMTRFGTVESVSFDATRGAIVGAYAFGLTFAMNFAYAVWNGQSFDEALKNSTSNGLKVGGISFITTVLSAQLQRTALNSLLKGPVERIANFIGPKASKYLSSAFVTGNIISESAAINSASKIIRTNAITGAVTVAVLSSGDVADLFRNRISRKQLVKNVGKTTATVVGGTGGWMAGASAGAAIGSVLPGPGTVVGGVAGGIIGSLAVGSAAGKASSVVLDKMIEDDAAEMLKILETEFRNLAVDYVINQTEAEKIMESLANITDSNFIKEMFASDNRNYFAREKLEPLFEDVAKNRKKIILPSEEQVLRELESTLALPVP